MKIIALLAVLCLSSCVTTTTTAPDGTVTVTRSVDLPAFNSGAAAVTTIVDSNRGK